MLDRILHHFPPHTHALTLVSDPDGLLADEEVLTTLAERGFRLINEPDPIRLRYRVEQARPFNLDHPLIVVTAGPLNHLPYDLWQSGRHVALALHTFFPHLAYPVVRQLSPAQRSRLGRSPTPARRLGRQATIEYVLRHVFGVDLTVLAQPARLIVWLDSYHQQAGTMPVPLIDHLLQHLQQALNYADWPLEELLANRDAFTTFIEEQWLACVQQQSGELLSERRIGYVLSFERDDSLQDTLPRLVRSGTLIPVQVAQPGRLPVWARPAVISVGEDRRPRRVTELLSVLNEDLDASPADARWEQWQSITRSWAELNTLRYALDGTLDSEQNRACETLEKALDTAFQAWLRQRYAPLGSQRLPLPHHVHHIPHYLAYQRRQRQTERIALFILDGMALADWYLIRQAWRARHPAWRFEEQLVLAQIPTITAISRQALVSGLRPAEFAATLDHNRAEPSLWAAFWAREDLTAEACAYVRLPLDEDNVPAEVHSARVRALCLVNNSIDRMLHGASLGGADLQASLRIWLEEKSGRLEAVIAGLLERGFVVYVTSDHGHVEAQGMGRPSEGVLVQTRSKRARVYDNWHAAANVQHGFKETILWNQDGLLPNDVWILMPEQRAAFVTFGEIVVTHGGPTLDEVVVPLVTIT